METRPLAILTNEDGTPKLAALHMRESTTAPGRMKVAFTSNLENGIAVRTPDGALQEMAIPKGVEGDFGLCEEFRLEMN